MDHHLVCGDCKVGSLSCPRTPQVLADNMDTEYFTCSAYCAAVGRVCTGAWEEDHDTCTVLTTETCDHDFGAYTGDAICECGDPGINPGVVVDRRVPRQV